MINMAALKSSFFFIDTNNIRCDQLRCLHKFDILHNMQHVGQFPPISPLPVFTRGCRCRGYYPFSSGCSKCLLHPLCNNCDSINAFDVTQNAGHHTGRILSFLEWSQTTNGHTCIYLKWSSQVPPTAMCARPRHAPTATLDTIHQAQHAPHGATFALDISMTTMWWFHHVKLDRSYEYTV